MDHYDVAPVPDFHPEIGVLLASMHDSTREWRENLGEPTVEAICWQPAPEFHSIGTILLHIAECEAYWFEQFVAKLTPDAEETKLLKAEEILQDDVKWPDAHPQPIEWYFELHDRIRARSWNAIREIEPERVIVGNHGSFTLRWIVAHVLEHDSYHGGQAVLLHELWRKGFASLKS